MRVIPPIREAKVHLTAKRKVARWLSAAASRGEWGLVKNDRIRIEMPLALDRLGQLVIWHDEPWAARRTPGSLEMARRGFWAPYRFDLAITRPGKIVLGVEILNAFEVSEEKAAALNTMPFPVVEMSASWVADQRRVPTDWSDGILRSFGAAA